MGFYNIIGMNAHLHCWVLFLEVRESPSHCFFWSETARPLIELWQKIRVNPHYLVVSFTVATPITRGCNCHLPSKQYESRNTQQCIVPMLTQGPKQSWWPHVHGRHRGHPHQQWSSTQYLAENKGNDVISRRGQSGSIVYPCQNSGLNMMHIQGNGTSATMHPHPNRKFNCPRTTHQ